MLLSGKDWLVGALAVGLRSQEQARKRELKAKSRDRENFMAMDGYLVAWQLLIKL